MMPAGKINILDAEVVNKIAAGEVVERPASVVKELVENALDASAKSIDIEIASSGQSLIRVADDGTGMTEEDLDLACRAHSTSKIKDEKDLSYIRTLGFRGEALSSIAAVAQVDIISCPEGSTSGVYVYVESGEVLRKRPAGRAKGTTVEVRNLFYNVPARKKFLKKDSTELAEIVRIVGRFALSASDVAFKLTQAGRVLLHVPADLSRKERIALVLGKEVADALEELKPVKGSVSIEGFASRPSSTRKDSRAQLFFLNGRFVRSGALKEGLYSAYRSMLERGRHPACVIFIDISPEEVDVNVHPTKLQVKFRQDRQMIQAIEDTFEAFFDRLKTDQRSGRHFDISAQAPTGASERLVFEERPAVQEQFTYEYKGLPSGAVKRGDPVTRVRGEAPGDGSLFQFGGCYIVEVCSDRLTITDQHAAHERIYYELFSRARERGAVESQNLVFPVRIELSAEDQLMIERIMEGLKELGFSIEKFGNRSFVVQSIPAAIKAADVEAIVRDVVSEIRERDLKKGDMMDELVKITACKAAIKAGDDLTFPEMASLLDELSKCELPFTCPHGRPVTIELTSEEMEKRFRRK